MQIDQYLISEMRYDTLNTSISTNTLPVTFKILKYAFYANFLWKKMEKRQKRDFLLKFLAENGINSIMDTLNTYFDGKSWDCEIKNCENCENV